MPRKGEFVTLSFDPQPGHEQMGRRPALVISNTLFNERTGMAVVCPITNTVRPFPLHVPIPAGSNVTGVVMVEHVKSVDFTARHMSHIGRANDPLVQEVLALLDACLY